MKKIIIRLLALLPTCSTAVLIDVCYIKATNRYEVYSSTLFYLDSLVIGISFFVMAYTYSFFKEKLEQLW
jgi:hypothetical protein